MRPIRLVIEGVNSFTDAQELDFDAVGRVNLFCICGKTGAGKTTIFDSIMLALYGKSGKGNLADVVNLSRSSASVTFDFSANGEVYRVERTIKCRGEKADKSDKENAVERDALIKRSAVSECTLYKAGAPIAKGEEATAAIEEIVGLAASEFKNVYLLEQGEYAEFLKLTPAKQTEVVGKIFSLTRFGEVYSRANDRMKAADADAAAIQKSIETLGNVTDAEVQTKKSEIASLKAKAAAGEREIQRKRDEFEEMGKVRDAYKSALEKQRAVAESAERAERAKAQKAEADRALTDFEAEQVPDYNGELEEIRARINELSVLVERDRECEAAEKDALDKRAAAERKRGALEKIRGELNAKRETADADGQKLRAALCDAKTAAEKAERTTEALARLARVVNDDGRETAAASEINAVYYALRTELDKYNEVKRAAAKADAEREEAMKHAGEELDKIERLGKELEAAKSEATEAAATAEKAEAALTKARVDSYAAAVAAELHAGDRCPVCGGEYRGGACAAGDVEARKVELDEALAAKRDADKKYTTFEKLTDNAKLKYEQYDAAVKSAQAEQDAAAKALEQTGVEERTHESVLDALARAEKLAAAYERSKDAEKSLLPAAEKAAAEKAAAETAADQSSARAAELALRLGEYRGKAAGELGAVKQKQSDIEKLAGAREQKRKDLGLAVAAAEATLKAAEEGLEAARRACPSEAPEFDEGAYVAAKEDLERLRDKAAALATEKARAETEFAVLEEKVKQRKSLDSQMDGAIKTYNIYKEIAEITKSKKMLDFVAAEYIEDFTAAASGILAELSGGKYTMRYDRDGGFVVSDFLNDGKARKTDTLSGGEMFLASLAVAIAIARSVSGGDNAFFFLDEGFGTLDDELIDTVYAALESLASSCLVGVISHSSALIERMPSCVEVMEATDTTGSRIKY